MQNRMHVLGFVDHMVTVERLTEAVGSSKGVKGNGTACSRTASQPPKLTPGFFRFARAANPTQLPKSTPGFFRFARAANPTQLPKLTPGFFRLEIKQRIQYRPFRRFFFLTAFLGVSQHGEPKNTTKSFSKNLINLIKSLVRTYLPYIRHFLLLLFSAAPWTKKSTYTHARTSGKATRSTGAGRIVHRARHASENKEKS
jgi:hypothetical protein